MRGTPIVVCKTKMSYLVGHVGRLCQINKSSEDVYLLLCYYVIIIVCYGRKFNVPFGFILLTHKAHNFQPSLTYSTGSVLKPYKGC